MTTDINPKGLPLNVLIQLQGTAAAYVRAAETKQAYEALTPPAEEPAVAKEPRARPAPLGLVISPGRRIVPDMSKYVTDRELKKRTRLPG